MREIKFRVYDKDSKNMYNQDDFILTFDTVGEDIYLSKNDEVIPLYSYELMQYTGLKDKNGKEIYDGDIVKLYSTETDKLGSENYTITYTKDAEWALDDSYLLSRKYKYCEIIGNVYEDKSLLK